MQNRSLFRRPRAYFSLRAFSFCALWSFALKTERWCFRSRGRERRYNSNLHPLKKHPDAHAAMSRRATRYKRKAPRRLRPAFRLTDSTEIRSVHCFRAHVRDYAHAPLDPEDIMDPKTILFYSQESLPDQKNSAFGFFISTDYIHILLCRRLHTARILQRIFIYLLTNEHIPLISFV